MGARAVIRFRCGDYVAGAVYLHWYGRPSEVHANMADFFGAVESQCDSDTRFDDPSYLAAKFVVWFSAKMARDPARPLRFLSIGLAPPDSTDSWTYDVECADRLTRPVVTEVKDDTA